MPAKPKGEYASDWHATAKLVKEDAGCRCVRCGESHCPSLGFCLTVHHFDGDKSNNARWNLMALCQRCHLSVQGRVDPEVPLLLEPSDWIRPYLAGMYEAGVGVAGPTYDLATWKAAYERAVGPWPKWAPAIANARKAEKARGK